VMCVKTSSANFVVFFVCVRNLCHTSMKFSVSLVWFSKVFYLLVRRNRLSLAEKLKLFSEKLEVRPSPATPSMRRKNRRQQSRFKTQVRHTGHKIP